VVRHALEALDRLSPREWERPQPFVRLLSEPTARADFEARSGGV